MIALQIQGVPSTYSFLDWWSSPPPNGLSIPSFSFYVSILEWVCKFSFLGFVYECGKKERGRLWRKRKEQIEEIEDIEIRRLWGFIFLRNTKSSFFGETQILNWMRILDGLYECFKFNLHCYNILKIKNISWPKNNNISIISISLSFSKQILFHKTWKISPFSHMFLILQNSPFQTPKQSLSAKQQKGRRGKTLFCS